MKVSKENAMELLSSLGFQGVDKYSDAKLSDKLNSLHAAKGAAERVAKMTPGMKKLGEQVIAASAKLKGSVEITADQVGEAVADEDTFALGDDTVQSEEFEEVESQSQPEEKNVPTATPTKPAAKPVTKPTPAKTTPTKPPVAPAVKPTDPKPPKEAKEPKAKRVAAEADAFGSRMGTRASRINAVVTETPKMSKQIATDAKYDKDPHNHLRWMVENGWAELVKGEGYKLTKKAVDAHKTFGKGGSAPAVTKPTPPAAPKPAVKPVPKPGVPAKPTPTPKPAAKPAVAKK